MFGWFKRKDKPATAEDSAVPVITIDGPSGSGKGTIARRVADALGYHLLDSGALYRLVALAAEDACVELQNSGKLAQIAQTLDVRFDSNDGGEERIWLAGVDVTHRIRTEHTGAGASIVAQIPVVREALFERQRAFRQPPGLVADGRDMGTQVFPDAELKVLDVSLAALSRDIEYRDRRDSERTLAPLKPAMDARFLDSSGQSIEAVTQAVLDWVAEL
jgi:cytidylate kinase